MKYLNSVFRQKNVSKQNINLLKKCDVIFGSETIIKSERLVFLLLVYAILQKPHDIDESFDGFFNFNLNSVLTNLFS